MTVRRETGARSREDLMHSTVKGRGASQLKSRRSIGPVIVAEALMNDVG